MTPERILTLLDVLEKSAKTPALSHLGSAALEALKSAVLTTVEQPNSKETPSSPPMQAPSVPRRTG
jgi:hypothetical protein